ncbi:methylenetetrahydrofolate reductase [Marinomonas atlantica]|uniref:methylenetetrahydrofolate reductase n=1 Tax=Marinomonas atlantica TaxID=1806668 RepID=UPI00082FEC63|nr:methylenetetrahydrofolate reductase [Marinomonas atlantica]
MTTCLPKFSLETTGKSVKELSTVADMLPTRTPVNIAFLGNETHEQRIQAAVTIKSLGLEPTPILSSRRVSSKADLDYFVNELKYRADIKRLMFVGGDPVAPEGPYENSLALFESNILKTCDVETIVIAGYPEGHPHITSNQLMVALKWKIAFLRKNQYKIEITTQLAFCTTRIIKWVQEIRAMGIIETIRIGVPCPTKVKTIRHFANLFGVPITADSLANYEMDTANLQLDANTDSIFVGLAQQIERLGIKNAYFHLYTLDGVNKNTLWIQKHL